ncbi:hypothetical protein [Sphingomonas sp. DT-204]|uniref:hypothetical protein n=1 Tax=Sphingomonas sp. DT-204 TaxID=3396166 RepID=UPI003F199E56
MEHLTKTREAARLPHTDRWTTQPLPFDAADSALERAIQAVSRWAGILAFAGALGTILFWLMR